MKNKLSPSTNKARFDVSKAQEAAIRKTFYIEYTPETLKLLRQYRKLTQAQLARLARTSAAYVSELERDLSQPSVELIGRLGIALEVIFFK